MEPPILFTDFTRFLKRARPFFVEAAKIDLNVLNVGLKVVPDEVCIFLSSLRVAWNEGSWGRETGLCRRISGQKCEENYSLNATDSVHSGAPKFP